MIDKAFCYEFLKRIHENISHEKDCTVNQFYVQKKERKAHYQQ